MEILETVLPIVINILLIVLITVGIILGIKCISVLNKAKSIMLNVEGKVNSLNSLFYLIDMINAKVTSLTEKVIDITSDAITKIFNKKDKEVESSEEE